VPYLRDAMIARGGPPAGFVYGMNFYTGRLKTVLDEWPEHGFDVPVMVSEFAPAGLRRDDRPAGFRAMWDTLTAKPELVLGAAPYVWMTEGPEAVDRLFGMVDADSRPVDGTLEALREIYGGTGDLSLVVRPSGLMPPLVGLTVPEALAQIEAAGLVGVSIHYTTVDDDEFLPGLACMPPGFVAHQYPPANAYGTTTPISLIVKSNPDGTIPDAVLPGAMLDELLGRSADWIAAATDVERDVVTEAVAARRATGLQQQVDGVEDGMEIDPLTGRLVDLVAWAKVLSDVIVDDRPVFPGAREALPLLAGMVRWGFEDQESLDVAERFLRDVLVRDLQQTNLLGGSDSAGCAPPIGRRLPVIGNPQLSDEQAIPR
jgi:hypothetical protein